MIPYNETSLWVNSTKYSEKDKSKLDEITTAYSKMHERTKFISAQIFSSIPNFTIHDDTHIEALWEIASLIVGPDYKLTPTELFVLGGSFLIHDLAMTKLLYENGINGIEQQPEWKDLIIHLLNKKLGRKPNKQEIIDVNQDIQDEATSEIIRLKHADLAEFLTINPCHFKNKQYFLIEDEYLRENYGHLIGKIAKSHWLSVEDLGREFGSEIGAPGRYPNSWSVNSLL